MFAGVFCRFTACVGDVVTTVLQKLGHNMVFYCGPASAAEQGIPDFAVKELLAADSRELFTGEGKVGCMACGLAKISQCQLVLLAVMPGVDHHMPNANNGSLRKQEAS
jgi:hypothetical protein